MSVKVFTISAVAITAMLAGSAFAAPKGGQPGSGNNPSGQNQGFVTRTVTISLPPVIYMGMSQKLAPNAHAAASNGTRTEVTSYDIDVTGPKGQVDGYVEDPTGTCNNCEFSAPTNERTEITDLPGNRS